MRAKTKLTGNDGSMRDAGEERTENSLRIGRELVYGLEVLCLLGAAVVCTIIRIKTEQNGQPLI